MEMRWYQAEAVQALYKYIQDKQGNPLLVLPTGAGKGFIMGQIAKDMTEWGCRLLLVAHVKELVDQNAKQAGRLIGHDKVGVYSAGIGRRDKSHQVISAGIQSIYNKACDLGSFDLILCDEVHRFNSEEGMYKTFIDDMKVINPNVRLAGLTATPFRMKTGHLTDEGGLFTDVAYEVGIRALISQGHLSKIVGKNSKMDIDFSQLHTRMGDFVDEEVDLLMNADDVVNRAVDELVAMSQDRKGIVVFGSSVNHAKHVANRLREITGEDVREVYGEVGNAERDEIISGFKAKEFRWIVNKDVLTVGFDAPHVDCVALMRPTKSAGLYIQAVGRGLRLAEGKENCIASGSLVLTNKGLVKIEDITKNMMLWDGVEFVNHDGLVFRGEQDTIDYLGITATGDHNVFTESGWQELSYCKKNNLPIFVTGDGRNPIKLSSGNLRRSVSERCEGVYLPNDGVQNLWKTRRKGSCNHQEENSWVQKMWKNKEFFKTSIGGSKVVNGEMFSGQTKVHKQGESIIQKLWGEGHKVYIQKPKSDGAIYNGRSLRRGKIGSVISNRQNRQQLALYEREYKDCSRNHKHEQYEKIKWTENDSLYENVLSRRKIRRFNNVKAFFHRVFRGPNNRQILQSSIVKTKRKVWDILNSGPRHRFTCNGLLVSNCLLLDFGGNILRHGPIDMVNQDRMMKKKGKGDGEAPSKVCPECQNVVLAQLRVCPECSFEFITAEKPPHEARASILSVLSEPAKPITCEVQDVSYQVWEGKSGIATMAVSYWVNINEKIMEWVCLNHEKGSFAHQKACQWWSMRSIVAPPEDVEQAVFMAKAGALAKPKSITYLEAVGKSFPSIKSIEIGEKPDYYLGMKKDVEPWKEFDEGRESDGFFGYKSSQEDDSFDDMPF